MKVICDVHISYAFTRHLNEVCESAIHVNKVLDGDRTADVDIADYADANGLIVLSRDTDFPLRFSAGLSPRHLIHLKLSNRDIPVFEANFDQHLPLLREIFGEIFGEISPQSITFHTAFLWTRSTY